ncbi:isopenicillin N synthase [Artemisia annua]|uniref:Isopenicillin N synthase n=1 Tax=Artemisia annua TaxID=35608 RepID=A0A2U1N055_ARTAN|nr:isopenicillin N synthase [Artemisia annua]
MAEVVPFDLVEQILLRLGVKDLLRCKSVCKLWQSLILSYRFVKYHMNHANNKDNNNKEIGHRRILMPEIYRMNMAYDMWYYMNSWQIVGSSNGLVCVTPVDAQVYVANPSIREVKDLPTPPICIRNEEDRKDLCWGFGYDSSIDDYKVVIGVVVVVEGKYLTRFQLLTLKSNTWKFIGDLKYTSFSTFASLCNGSLHWIMKDSITKKWAIISFNLSQEKFKEISQPDDSRYAFDSTDISRKLGIVEGCLCIFNVETVPNNTWVMKNYNVSSSWELLPYDCLYNTRKYIEQDDHMYRCSYIRTMYDIAYKPIFNIQPNDVFYNDKDIYLSKTTAHMGDPIFVESLVSPHVNGRPKQVYLGLEKTTNGPRRVVESVRARLCINKWRHPWDLTTTSFVFSHHRNATIEFKIRHLAWMEANYGKISSNGYNSFCLILREVVRKIARLIALALDLEANFFDRPEFLGRPIAVLRLLHYEGQVSDPTKGMYGAGAHSDYGLVTLLATDCVSGLQICKDKDAKPQVWEDVKPLKGAFVVNLGDMLERWSNRIFRSTLHRVLVNGQERYSIPFFVEPSHDCVVECLPTCQSKLNPPKIPFYLMSIACLVGVVYISTVLGFLLSSAKSTFFRDIGIPMLI